MCVCSYVRVCVLCVCVCVCVCVCDSLLRNLECDVKLEIFAFLTFGTHFNRSVTFYKILSARQLGQVMQIHQHFGDSLRLHTQGTYTLNHASKRKPFVSPSRDFYFPSVINDQNL